MKISGENKGDGTGGLQKLRVKSNPKYVRRSYFLFFEESSRETARAEATNKKQGKGGEGWKVEGAGQRSGARGHLDTVYPPSHLPQDEARVGRGPPGTGSVRWERRADRTRAACDLQDNCQGANPKAGRADLQLGLGSIQEEVSLSLGYRRPQGRDL